MSQSYDRRNVANTARDALKIPKNNQQLILINDSAL